MTFRPVRIIHTDQATCHLIYSKILSTIDWLSRRRKNRSNMNFKPLYKVVIRAQIYKKMLSFFFLLRPKYSVWKKWSDWNAQFVNKCFEENDKWSVLKKFCVETLNYKKCSLWNSQISLWEKKQINDELMRILTLITNYFLLMEPETINKKKNNFLSFKQVANSPQYSTTRLLTLTYSWRFHPTFQIKSHPIRSQSKEIIQTNMN